MQVIVAANVPPVANAGADVSITLPVDSISIFGKGTDVDGTVTAYHWVKISGPSKGSIGNASSPTVLLTNLGQGVYLYELTVTDNNGAKGKDTVQVTVNAATATTATPSLQVVAGPVPAQTSLTAQISNVPAADQKMTVSLTSISGTKVYSAVVPVTHTSVQSVNIDVSKLRTGTYFLNIKTNVTKTNYTTTIIKN